MFKEFFCQGGWKSRIFAWVGLFLIVGHAFMRAYIKYRLNEWYGRFYDLGGSAAEFGSGDVTQRDEGRRRVGALLLEFGILCLPSVVIHPFFALFTNVWTLNWRMRLMTSYIERWRVDDKKVENGNQRVHEDTQRFSRGVKTCCVVLLDAVLTLVTFAPRLAELGAQVQPVDIVDVWLLLLCVLVATGGLAVSVFLGWPLVKLEVANQRVEAELRRKLVLLEEEPSAVTQPLVAHFKKVLRDVRINYNRLYRNFAVFSLWLGGYEQSVTILPYLLAAPLLFSDNPERRITLGTVTMLSNAFSNVFSSLNVLSDRWIEVTDFLSVRRRLSEWEAHITDPPVHSARILIEPSIVECTVTDGCGNEASNYETGSR